MSVDYNYRNAFDLHSLTQSFEPQLDSNKIYKKTCPKISELPCKFPLPACCGAPNQSICPLYFCDAVYFLYGRFDFLYGKLFTFYMVNSTFYMIKPTFHMVNFSLTISVSVKRRPQSSDCKLQTGDKVQTEGKMQTEDCRPEINCTLGHKTTRFTGKTLKVSWDRGRVNCERRAIGDWCFELHFLRWFWRWHIVFKVRTFNNVGVWICSSQPATYISLVKE